MRTHPDKVPEEFKARATADFERVAAAYAVLSDASRRREHDIALSEGERSKLPLVRRPVSRTGSYDHFSTAPPAIGARPPSPFSGRAPHQPRPRYRPPVNAFDLFESVVAELQGNGRAPFVTEPGYDFGSSSQRRSRSRRDIHAMLVRMGLGDTFGEDPYGRRHEDVMYPAQGARGRRVSSNHVEGEKHRDGTFTVTKSSYNVEELSGGGVRFSYSDVSVSRGSVRSHAPPLRADRDADPHHPHCRTRARLVMLPCPKFHHRECQTCTADRRRAQGQKQTRRLLACRHPLVQESSLRIGRRLRPSHFQATGLCFPQNARLPLVTQVSEVGRATATRLVCPPSHPSARLAP